jgi:hypothetical protein
MIFFRLALQEQQVNGEMLLKGVDKELLRDDLGLKVAGDRFKVLNAIEYLRQSSVKYANSGKVQGKLLSFIPYSKH